MWQISLSSRYFWQAILDRLFPGRRQRGRRQQIRNLSRPRLEGLEDRLAPAVFNVTDGPSLVNAIATAAANADSSNTINLAAATYQVANEVINISALDKSLTIVGQGAAQSILTANQQGRVFEINGNVKFADLALTGGKVVGVAGSSAPAGGGLLIDGGQVTLQGVSVAGNRAVGADGAAATAQGGGTKANRPSEGAFT